MANASLKSHNQPQRKVRLVTDLVKGKKVSVALSVLEFLPRRAAAPVAKLIKSAAANAKGQGKDVDALVVKSIIVENAGMTKRFQPRAFGRAAPIRRRKSRILVTLAPYQSSVSDGSNSKARKQSSKRATDTGLA